MPPPWKPSVTVAAVVERVQTVAGVKDTYTLQTFNAFSGSRA